MARAGANLGAVQFDVEVDDSDVQKMLARFDAVLIPTNLAQFLRYVADPWFTGRAISRFRNEGDDVSGAWAPLKPYTVQQRESAGFPGEHPINHRTGEMERYIAQGSRTFMVAATQATMRMPGRGNASFNQKLKVAQQGAAYPRTVARPVIGMNERDLAVMLHALSQWVAQEMTIGSGGTLGTF